MSVNLNGLPSIVEVTNVKEYEKTAMVEFETNRFHGFMLLGEQHKKNFLSSYVESIGIAPLGDENFCIFTKGWESKPTDDVRNLAKKVVEAASDIEWRYYGPRNSYRRY